MRTNLPQKQAKHDLSWKSVEAQRCFGTATGREKFYIIQSTPSLGPKAVRDRRYGTCQNQAHCRAERKVAWSLPGREPSGLAPSWQRSERSLGCPTQAPGSLHSLYPLRPINSFHGRRVNMGKMCRGRLNQSGPGHGDYANSVFFVLGTNTHLPLCPEMCVHGLMMCAHTHTHTTHTVASQNRLGYSRVIFQIAVSFHTLRHLDFSFIFCIWVNSIFPSEETHKGRLLPLHRQLGECG